MPLQQLTGPCTYRIFEAHSRIACSYRVFSLRFLFVSCSSKPAVDRPIPSSPSKWLILELVEIVVWPSVPMLWPQLEAFRIHYECVFGHAVLKRFRRGFLAARLRSNAGSFQSLACFLVQLLNSPIITSFFAQEDFVAIIIKASFWMTPIDIILELMLASALFLKEPRKIIDGKLWSPVSNHAKLLNVTGCESVLRDHASKTSSHLLDLLIADFLGMIASEDATEGDRYGHLSAPTELDLLVDPTGPMGRW